MLQAAGLVAAGSKDRHVVLRWISETYLDGNYYIQLIHLFGGRRGQCLFLVNFEAILRTDYLDRLQFVGLWSRNLVDQIPPVTD